MSVDAQDTTVWPCRTPEDVIRERTWTRIESLRRRRRVPLVAAVALVLVGILVVPRPASPVRVAAEGGGDATSDQSGGEAEADNPSTTTTTAHAPGDQGPSVSPMPRVTEPPSHVVAPVVGPVPVFPREPVYASSHPLLEDPEGDAWTQVEPARAQSDPALDITRLDVRANPTAVTTELRILDLGKEPFTSAHYGRPSSLRYVSTLRRPEGYFSFYVVRQVGDGSVSAVGTYWKANAEAGNAGAYSGTDVTDLTWTLDEDSGIVRVTARFDVLNRALAANGHPPMGIGTTVVPTGRTSAMYTPAPLQNAEGGADGVAHTDSAYSYRLGD